MIEPNDGRTEEDVRDGGPVVLIVEDEAVIAWDVADSFADHGFRIAGPFSACAEALHFLETTLPDIAILDAVLNDGPCLELALELRRRGVPILMYSGEAIDTYGRDLEGVPWIEKPSPSENVVRAAKALLPG